MMRGVLVLLIALLYATTAGAGTIMVQGPVRHAAGGAPDYAVTKGFIYVDSNSTAVNIKLCIYNAAGDTLILCSDSTAIGTDPLWQEVAFTAGPTLVSSTRYQLRVIADGFWEPALTADAWRVYSVNTGTYGSPPATVETVPSSPVDDGDLNAGIISVYVQNTSSQTLIGTTTVGGTLTVTFDGGVIYGDTQGYVCCAF